MNFKLFPYAFRFSKILAINCDTWFYNDAKSKPLDPILLQREQKVTGFRTRNHKYCVTQYPHPGKRRVAFRSQVQLCNVTSCYDFLYMVAGVITWLLPTRLLCSCHGYIIIMKAVHSFNCAFCVRLLYVYSVNASMYICTYIYVWMYTGKKRDVFDPRTSQQ